MSKGKLKPFKTFVGMDTTTFVCPCGESKTNDTPGLEEFLRVHRKHTNGHVNETVTADGARCVADTYPRNRVYSL